MLIFMLADVHFIDGQALAPTDFGETDDNGVWQPKKFEGSITVSSILVVQPLHLSHKQVG